MVLLTAVQVHPLQLGKHHQVQCQMKLLSLQGVQDQPFTLSSPLYEFQNTMVPNTMVPNTMVPNTRIWAESLFDGSCYVPV